MKNKTVEEIVREYLEENGFDGLWNECDCACSLKDLFCCTCVGTECRAGYFQPIEDDSEYDFIIGNEKNKNL